LFLPELLGMLPNVPAVYYVCAPRP